jgi:hypothetical protein
MTTTPNKIFDEEEIELEPSVLKFGMSRAQVKELENKAKRKKKLTKKWKPTDH